MTSISDRSRYAPWSILLLRMTVGIGFLLHGYAKIISGPAHFAASLAALGVPGPVVMAWLTILVETIGGLAMLIGAWVSVVSVPLAVILIVAAVTVHLPYGFTSIKLRAVTAAGPQFGPPGYELNLLYLAALAVLVACGSGPLAIDARLRRKSSHRMRSVGAAPDVAGR